MRPASRKLLLRVARDAPVGAARVGALRRLGYSVGRDVYVGEGLHITDELDAPADGMFTIGDRASIAQRVTVVLSSHPNQSELRAVFGQVRASVRIGHDAWIGVGAILLPGVEVGHHAVVAAGAVVTASVEPWTVVGGVPARWLRDARA